MHGPVSLPDINLVIARPRLINLVIAGSSLLYKKFVHPALVRREAEIDLLLEEARSRGYNTAIQLGGRGAR